MLGVTTNGTNDPSVDRHWVCPLAAHSLQRVAEGEPPVTGRHYKATIHNHGKEKMGAGTPFSCAPDKLGKDYDCANGCNILVVRLAQRRW